MLSSKHEFCQHGSLATIDEDDGDSGSSDCGCDNGLVTLLFDGSGGGLWDFFLGFLLVENYHIELPHCVYHCLPCDWNWKRSLKNRFVILKFGGCIYKVTIEIIFSYSRKPILKHTWHSWKAKSLIIRVMTDNTLSMV